MASMDDSDYDALFDEIINYPDEDGLNTPNSTLEQPANSSETWVPTDIQSFNGQTDMLEPQDHFGSSQYQLDNPAIQPIQPNSTMIHQGEYGPQLTPNAPNLPRSPPPSESPLPEYRIQTMPQLRRIAPATTRQTTGAHLAPSYSSADILRPASGPVMEGPSPSLSRNSPDPNIGLTCHCGAHFSTSRKFK